MYVFDIEFTPKGCRHSVRAVTRIGSYVSAPELVRANFELAFAGARVHSVLAVSALL